MAERDSSSNRIIPAVEIGPCYQLLITQNLANKSTQVSLRKTSTLEMLMKSSANI
jgi:hypothetical protein